MVETYMRKLLFATCMIVLLIITSGIAYSADDNIVKKPDTLKFTTPDDLDYNLDSEEVVVPGKVEIEYGELKATGRNLYYDNKGQIATLEGTPKIIANYGKEIDLEMNRLEFDINAGILKMIGQCRLNSDRKNGKSEVVTEEMFFFPDDNLVKTPGKVSVWFRKNKTENATATVETQKDNKEIKSKKQVMNVEEFRMDSGPLNYSFKTGAIHAEGPIKIEFEGGYFNADNADGNLESKLMTFTGGASGSAGGISITADKIILDYANQEVDALGNVQVEHENGHKINAENIHACYREGEKTLSVKKGLTAELKMNDKSPKEH